MIGALVHGILLAFGLILPLGAQNIFVLNQGSSQPSFKKVIPVIITASFCDTLLILLAVMGVSIMVLAIPVFQTILFLIGFLFLLYMGWVVWNSKPASITGDNVALSPKKQILFAISVSLLNPHAILDTIGVIGTNSLYYSGSAKVVFTTACIVVSWLWFLGLAIIGRVIGGLDPNGRLLVFINKVSGILIWGVALYIGVQIGSVFK
ncbi:LysE/ArgO family amino acid transporter [Mesobacillus maritimus]|uniref:Amino acid transporter n=1 Tax=Mesobacillus maritimus TaxID=1643336 RepID=A0ABS7K029_9BACI|nr:LysE/ArgO family amino acid transporter [Mesobacillus maritimus]MBY0095607.1 amino acid transporter [Mesobacillus maritimus]